jgi:hypothetical protein
VGREISKIRISTHDEFNAKMHMIVKVHLFLKRERGFVFVVVRLRFLTKFPVGRKMVSSLCNVCKIEFSQRWTFILSSGV